jgi:hypothetical protein
METTPLLELMEGFAINPRRRLSRVWTALRGGRAPVPPLPQGKAEGTSDGSGPLFELEVPQREPR